MKVFEIGIFKKYLPSCPYVYEISYKTNVTFYAAAAIYPKIGAARGMGYPSSFRHRRTDGRIDGQPAGRTGERTMECHVGL